MPFTKRFLALSALALATTATAATTGCQNDTLPGTLVVPFDLVADRTCDELGVVDVAVTLDGEDTEEADCDDGEVVFTSLEPGNYVMVVQGLDDEGDAILDNLDDTEKERTVEVLGDGATTTADSVTLNEAPATLLVAWDLGTQNCNGIGIANFQIEAFDTSENIPEQLLESLMSCEDAIPDSQGYREAPDIARELDGDDFSELVITPLDASGGEFGDPIIFAEFEPLGPGKTIRVTIECDSDGCTGDGELD